MILAIVTVVLVGVVIALIVGAWLDGFSIGRSIGATVVFLVGGTLVWFVLLMTIAGLANILTPDFSLRDSERANLRALQVDSASSAQGSHAIFIGSYSQSEQPYFRYLYETDDGGVKVGNIEAHRGTVYEDEETAPYREKFTWHKVNDWFIWGEPFAEAETFAFHIPDGSVLDFYSVTPGR